MSKKLQIEKNLKLSVELADYLASNPNEEQKVPENASYVFFSPTDHQLNEVNLKLAKSLAKEGKTVIKAEKSKNKAVPWKLIPFSL